MSQEQVQLTYLKGVVSELPQEQQDELYAHCNAILEQLAKAPDGEAKAIHAMGITMALLQTTIDDA